MEASVARKTWSLRGRSDQEGSIRTIDVDLSPFQVGRRRDLPLCIPRPTISTVHAELVFDEARLWLKDLASTNGTFWNGKPVKDMVELSDGDLVQFADMAFRVCGSERDSRPRTQHTMDISESEYDQALALAQFDKLMSERAVVPYFQSIVTMNDREIVGYEVLGRSRFFSLQTPKAMFLAASQLNLETELSEMFRTVGMEKGVEVLKAPNLFLNTHPAEIVKFGLLESLRALRTRYPQQPITLEVHEAAVADAKQMHALKAVLHDLNVRLAYDDFGAGQARLLELVKVRPDYLKFDMQFIRDIDQADRQQQQMLGLLVKMAADLGVATIAEGVESDGEHAVCRDLGFDLGQGYLYGLPKSASSLTTGRDTAFELI